MTFCVLSYKNRTKYVISFIERGENFYGGHMMLKVVKKCFLFISAALLLVGTFSINGSAGIRTNTPDTRGYFFIKQVKSGSYTNGKAYWDQGGAPRRYKRGSDLKLWSHDKSFDRDQQFAIVASRNAKGWYNIRSRNGGYVDISGGKDGNGVKIQVWDKNDSHAQQFGFKYIGSGKWKIYTRWGRIIAAKGKNTKNGTPLHTWSDHNDRSNEWYLVDVRTKKLVRAKTSASSSSENKSSKPGITVDAAVQSKDSAVKGNYFGRVGYSQFAQDKAYDKIVNHYNGLKDATTQWTHMLYTIDAVKKNQDSRVRFYTYKALNAVQYKKANFAEKLVGTQMTKNMDRDIRNEKYSPAKKELEKLKKTCMRK